MKYGLDSAYPPSDPGRIRALGWQFVAGYLGPIDGTPHVWTADEWRAAADAHLELLPIWVAPYGDPSNQDGVDAGNAALQAMQDIGLSGMLALDVENGAQPHDFVLGFTSAVHAGSCSVVLYGSGATLVDAHDVDDWWLADWVQSGPALRRAPLDWAIWQYATGPQYDYDVAVNDFVFAQLAAAQP